MNIYANLLKNTSILFLGTICVRAISFLVVPLFSSWLSSEDFGMFDLLCIYVAMSVPLLSLSNGEGVFRKIIDADKERTIRFTTVAFIQTIVAALLFCIIVPIIFHFYNEQLTIPFLSLALGELIAYLLTNYARGKKKTVLYASSSFIFVCVMAVSVTYFVFLKKMGLPGILYGYSLGFYVESVFIVCRTGFFKDVNFAFVKRKDFAEMLSYSLPLIPNKISWNFVNIISRTLILLFIGAASNGVFAIASKIPIICTALFNSFHMSWQESAVDAMNSNEKNSFYNNVFNKSFELLLSTCMVILSFNHFLFTYIFDEKYYEAAYISPFLIMAMIFFFFSEFFSGIFNALQKTSVNGLSTIISALLNILFSLILIKFIGLYAIAIATLFSYMFLFVFRWVKLKKFLSLSVNSDIVWRVLIFLVFVVIQYINCLNLHLLSIPVSLFLFVYMNRFVLIKITKKLKRNR
jgi:O-antigen/teichoic acid export membrane protein